MFRKYFKGGGLVIILAVLIFGCTEKYESESIKQFSDAKKIVSSNSSSIDDLRFAEFCLYKIDPRSSVYQAAQKMIPELKAEIKKIHDSRKPEKPFTKEEVASTAEARWLREFRTATEVSLKGKNKAVMIVKVDFLADRSRDIIHDYAVINTARSAGIKRIEYHDWGHFAKDYISVDLKK